MTKTTKTKKASTPRDPLLRAARAWWLGHKPWDWTLAEYLASPETNVSREGITLARAVARTYGKRGAR